MAVKKATKEDDFTYAELIEYEDLAGEPLDALNDSDRPRLKKIAYLGWIRAKRANEALKFTEYVNETSAEQIMKDAFGDQTEAKKEKTSSEKTEQ